MIAKDRDAARRRRSFAIMKGCCGRKVGESRRPGCWAPDLLVGLVVTSLRYEVKVRVWRYRVAPDMREEFEREYGTEGSWAQLFATATGFVETSLYRGARSATTYITVDRFVSEQAWRQFRTDNDAAYTTLGERLAHLTLEQEELV
jgi:hypothetical protein